MLAWILLALLSAPPARAWDRHAQITRVALSALADLSAPVKAESFSDYLTAAGFKGTAADFARALKINPVESFGFNDGETAGADVPLRRVIEDYSDEPDWGMDNNLFDVYPELWKDSYLYMGGRDGSQNRAFRHMYWPSGFYKPPVPPAKFPVYDPTPLGEAPERSQLFFEKSQEAFRTGHPYWGARFLACALHYYEDLTMPFHAVQLPGFSFVRFGPDGTVDVEGTTRMFAYYHLALDAYPSRALGAETGPEIQKRLLASLSGGDVSDSFEDAALLSRQAATASALKASEVGDVVVAFFPVPTLADERDPLARVRSADFWDTVRRNQLDHPNQTEDLVAFLASTLKSAGVGIRTLVRGAMKTPPQPPAPRPLPTLQGVLLRLDGVR